MALGLAALLGVTLTAQAPAQAHEGGVKVGDLTCNVAGGWGKVIGSSRRVNCVFSPSHRAAERYTGHITKIGLDLGYRSSGTIVWAVFAPTDRLGRGDLHGSYGGGDGKRHGGCRGGRQRPHRRPPTTPWPCSRSASRGAPA